MLLIHCVVEDAFWLLNGLVGNVMNQYFTDGEAGLKVDAAVFGGVLAGSEVKLGKKFRELGIHRKSLDVTQGANQEIRSVLRSFHALLPN